MNPRDPNADENQSLEELCFECGAHCCRLGGVIATQNEVDAIIAEGFPNHFISVTQDVYGTDWGADGDCPYLEENKCSIYSVRPLGCRMFPVVQTRSNGIVLVHCPLGVQLTEDEKARRKQLLEQRPDYLLKGSEHHRSDHIDELETRARRYTYEEL